MADISINGKQIFQRSAFANQMQMAIEDMLASISGWRVWAMLALNDTKRRYRRSRIGQFWLTISMAVNVVAMGVLWGVIFHTDVRNTLPFIGVGLIVWALMAGIVQDATTTFVGAEGYLKQIRVSKTAIVCQAILKNFIVFAHNIVIVPFILLMYPPEHMMGFLLIPIGLFFYAINGVWIGLLLGMLCTRFRDLPQIVQSIMQIMFFMTPILWNPAQIGPEVKLLVALNPFASFLMILRSPLLGIVPDAGDYWMAIAVTIVGFGITLPLFARFRSRIVYWL
jgi:ABC-type polysaccharide/polyol phosphate export permease